MSRHLRRSIRAGAVGFACGLILALIYSVRPERALLRASQAALCVAGAVLLASSLNLKAPKADEGEAFSPESTDQHRA